MKRRSLLTAAALCALPALVFADESHVDYTPQAYQQMLASGEPFLLDFYASW